MRRLIFIALLSLVLPGCEKESEGINETERWKLDAARSIGEAEMVLRYWCAIVVDRAGAQLDLRVR